MEVQEHKEIKYQLILTREEAKWLKGYMQNDFVQEDSVTEEMRHRFFNALPSFRELDR